MKSSSKLRHTLKKYKNNRNMKAFQWCVRHHRKMVPDYCSFITLIMIDEIFLEGVTCKEMVPKYLGRVGSTLSV